MASEVQPAMTEEKDELRVRVTISQWRWSLAPMGQCIGRVNGAGWPARGDLPRVWICTGITGYRRFWLWRVTYRFERLLVGDEPLGLRIYPVSDFRQLGIRRLRSLARTMRPVRARETW